MDCDVLPSHDTNSRGLFFENTFVIICLFNVAYRCTLWLYVCMHETHSNAY
jgi:hypothetical protein